MSDKHFPAEHESIRQKPGHMLRQAREKLGMELKDIASQLNLQADIIASLEDDDSDKLPAPTYVRGYIRSYARIVHLDGNTLISLYDHEAAAPPEIIPDIRQDSQMNSHDRPVKAFTYLVTFIMALLLVAWLLQSNYSSQLPVVSNDEAPAVLEDEPETVTDSPAELPEYSAPAAELPPYYEGTAPAVSVPIEQPALVLDESGLINNIGLPDTTNAIDTTPLPTEAAGTGEIENPANDSQINLKIIKESWVEIYDAGNNRLYLGLGRPGEEISLSGIPPFNVLLGYSPGVEVSYNGKAFDPSPYSTSGVAKFILGTAAEAEEEQSE